MREKNKTILFWAITLMLPLLLLLLTEGVLRVVGYEREKQELFIEAPNTPEYLLANAKFVRRYFPVFIPEIAPNAFRKEKLPNTFRVFVFGGSSTEGFPYNFYNSFADQLEQKLLVSAQGRHIEIINLGMTAVNSYVIRDLSQRVLPYEPDAVIIYAGHNEFYGSFGAATTQFGFTDSIRLKHLILWLKNWRVYQRWSSWRVWGAVIAARVIAERVGLAWVSLVYRARAERSRVLRQARVGLARMPQLGSNAP